LNSQLDVVDAWRGTMPKKILVVLSGTEKLPNLNRTIGVWLDEIVRGVEKIKKAGFEVENFSPKGGYASLGSGRLAIAEPGDWDWYWNKGIMEGLGANLKSWQISPDEYAAILFVGGHGAMWDFPGNEELQAISRKIYESGGIVASVCHGALGLLNLRLSDGTMLISGKRVTAFSNEEEKLADLDNYVPFLTEDELVKRGAIYTKTDRPWTAHAVADERVITGQNPASVGEVVDLLIQQLQGQVDRQKGREGEVRPSAP
jgi:putative intracellular protease/amidase